MTIRPEDYGGTTDPLADFANTSTMPGRGAGKAIDPLKPSLEQVGPIADRIAWLEQQIGHADDLYHQSGQQFLFKDRVDDLRAELSRLRNPLEQPGPTADRTDSLGEPARNCAERVEKLIPALAQSDAQPVGYAGQVAGDSNGSRSARAFRRFRMTTRPEDVMTRERALEALTSLLAITGKLSSAGGENLSLRNARYELRRWGEKYNYSLDRALASAKQEPAPSADAEEVLVTITIDCTDAIVRELKGLGFDVAEVRLWIQKLVSDSVGKAAALRRYAGDGGVTAVEWPYEVWQAGASKWHELDLEAKRLNSVIGTRVDMLKFIWAAMKDAAARAKPSEKS